MATNSKSKNVPKTKSPSVSASPTSAPKSTSKKEKADAVSPKPKSATGVNPVPTTAKKKSKAVSESMPGAKPVSKKALDKKPLDKPSEKKVAEKLSAVKTGTKKNQLEKVDSPKVSNKAAVATTGKTSSKEAGLGSKVTPKSSSAKAALEKLPAKTAAKSTPSKKAIASVEPKTKSSMIPAVSSVKSSKSKQEELKIKANAATAKKGQVQVNEDKGSGSKKIGTSNLKAADSKAIGSTGKSTNSKNPSAKPMHSEKPAPAPINNGPPTDPTILAKIRGMQSDQEKRKDFAQLPTAKPVLIHSSKLIEQPKDPAKDRLILMVRDPFWLHACWDITRKSVERAKAALAGHWHAARPVLRLLRTEDNSTTSNSESVFKDILIHGGVRNWYIDVEDAETTFRILLGYLFANGRFHELARSNPVTTPVPGSPDATDDHWADIATDAERVYALSGGYDEESTQAELQQMMQEKLKRPVGTPAMSQFGSGAEGSLKRSKNFHFNLDAEMVVFGSTPANAYLTLNGEPIKIRSDGTYSARVPLPNQRQVMAATSKSRDGLDEQTIVIAVERNTKIMEPLSLTEPDLD